MSSVLTVQIIMMLSATSCTTPGWAYHQMIVAAEASTNSTIMPAAETAIRFHLLLNRQASLTSQYKHGENTSSMKPISCTSPPKCLHASACPNSCSTFTMPIASNSQTRFRGSTNALNSGNRSRNSSKCPTTSDNAQTTRNRDGNSESGEKSQRN